MKYFILVIGLLSITCLSMAYSGDGVMYGGYYWATNIDESDTLSYHPEYSWINLGINANSPTFSNSDTDDGYALVPLGFTFSYFGNDYNSIYLCTNGYCVFTNPVSASYLAGNMSIPNTNAPNNAIALCAMDLQTDFIPSTCLYGNDLEGNFVFSVTAWNDYNDDEEMWDVQLILYQTGRIKIQYNNIPSYVGVGPTTMIGDCCIGIENSNGSDGHQYRNNGVGGDVESGMALCYAQSPELLSESGELLIYQNELDFGYCEMSTDADTLLLEIRNPSLGVISILEAPSLSGDISAFTVVDDYIYPQSISPGGQLVYPIIANRDSTGLRTADFSFTNGVDIYQTLILAYNYYADNNDISEEATELGALTFGTDIFAEIAPENDVDWYLFWLTPYGDLSIHTETPPNSALDLKAKLYGPFNDINQQVDNTSLIDSDNDGWIDQYNPLITVNNLQNSGFYYLKIEEETVFEGYEKDYTLIIEYTGDPYYFVPNPPYNLEVELVSSGIQLTWEWGDGFNTGFFAGFNVYRDDQMISQTLIQDSLFVDTNYEMTSGTVYEYKVTANNIWENSESAPCDSVLFTIPVAGFFDDFESFPDFSSNLNPWITYDLDGSQTQMFTNWIDYPYEGEAISFISFNPSATTPPLEGYNAYSGDKFAASICSAIGQNENWLITPRIQLSNEPASVSFMARSFTAQFGMEQLQVGISDGSLEIGDFEFLTGSTPVLVPEEWECYSYSLDQYSGAEIRIGILSNSTGTFMLMLDDFLVSNPGATVHEEEQLQVQNTTNLYTNYPNPFNPTTNISFSVSSKSMVQIAIYNVKGQRIKTLCSEILDKGEHDIIWDGKDENNNPVTSGIYFCKMKNGSIVLTNKMVLMK